MAIFINRQRKNLKSTIIPIANLDFSTLLQKHNIPPQFWMNGLTLYIIKYNQTYTLCKDNLSQDGLLILEKNIQNQTLVWNKTLGI